MRNIPLAEVDHLDRAIVAIGTDHPDHLLEFHRHRRAQFLYGATGVMRVETTDGTWTVPPQRAVLIPPRTDHQVLMRGVSTRSLYLEPAAVPWFPARCQVVDVTPLLRELVLTAVDIAPEYPPRGRDGVLMELILHELLRTPRPLPFELPLPRDERLHARCTRFQTAPTIQEPVHAWARALNVSERTVNRLFRDETGLSYRHWRARACVLHAIRLLADDTSVTRIAGMLGYENPAAFTTMFRRETGSPPSRFRPGTG